MLQLSLPIYTVIFLTALTKPRQCKNRHSSVILRQLFIQVQVETKKCFTRLVNSNQKCLLFLQTVNHASKGQVLQQRRETISSPYSLLVLKIKTKSYNSLYQEHRENVAQALTGVKILLQIIKCLFRKTLLLHQNDQRRINRKEKND